MSIDHPTPPHIDAMRFPLVAEADRVAAEFTAKGLPEAKVKLRNAVRFAYDAQRLRIQMALRITPKEGDKAPPIHLDDDDKKFIEGISKAMKATEDKAKNEVDRLCVQHYPKVYSMMRAIRGIGPIGAGVFISCFHVERAVYPSQWWAHAGLAVVDVDPETGRGHAPKPVKGEKLPYNAWLRTKVLFVIGGCLLKSGNDRYCEIYEGIRARRINQLGPCMNCKGTGQAGRPKKAGARVDPEAGKLVACWNCVGDLKNKGRFTPQRAPWGKSHAHRHQDALRRMVKTFIADVWYWWRTSEGLPVVGTYGEVKLGLRAHSKDPLGDSVENDVLAEDFRHTEDGEE